MERRRFERSLSSARVEARHPELGLLVYTARDVSDGGIFVLFSSGPKLPVGTELMVTIKRHTGAINQSPVPMRIVHHQRDGMGLMFIRN